MYKYKETKESSEIFPNKTARVVAFFLAGTVAVTGSYVYFHGQEEKKDEENAANTTSSSGYYHSYHYSGGTSESIVKSTGSQTISTAVKGGIGSSAAGGGE